MGFSLKKSLGKVGTVAATGGLSMVYDALKPKKVPAPPGMSAEEARALGYSTDLLDSYRGAVDQEAKAATNDQQLYQMLSGLFNPDGSLNNEAVASLSARVKASEAGDETLQGLERAEYERALRGETAANPTLERDRAQEFARMKEAYARRGIQIDGDSPETASSNSTAGLQALSKFNERYAVLRDQDRRAALEFGSSLNLNRLGMGATPGRMSLGFASEARAKGPASVAPLYSDLSARYLGSTQPYTDQRMLGYQRDVTNTNNSNQFNRDLLQLGSQIGAAYLTSGGSMATQRLPQSSYSPRMGLAPSGNRLNLAYMGGY